MEQDSLCFALREFYLKKRKRGTPPALADWHELGLETWSIVRDMSDTPGAPLHALTTLGRLEFPMALLIARSWASGLAAQFLATRSTELHTPEDSALGMSLAYVAAAAGANGAVLEASVRYAETRKQFGTPIASFGAVVEHIGVIAQEEARQRSLVMTWSECAEELQPTDVVEAARDATRGLVRSADSALRVLGGVGYMAETSIELASGERCSPGAILQAALAIMT